MGNICDIVSSSVFRRKMYREQLILDTKFFKNFNRIDISRIEYSLLDQYRLTIKLSAGRDTIYILPVAKA